MEYQDMMLELDNYQIDHPMSYEHDDPLLDSLGLFDQGMDVQPKAWAAGPQSWIPVYGVEYPPVPQLGHTHYEYRTEEPSIGTISESHVREQNDPLSPVSASSYGGTPAPYPLQSGLEEQMEHLRPGMHGDAFASREARATVEKAPANSPLMSPLRRRKRSVAHSKQAQQFSLAACSPRRARLSGSSSEADLPYDCGHVTYGDHGEEIKCQWRGRIVSEQKKHMDKHRRPHKCDRARCQRGFTTSSDLERHKWTKHDFPPAKGASKWHCKIGECKFKKLKGGDTKRKDNFVQHIHRIHTRDENEIRRIVQDSEKKYYGHHAQTFILEPGATPGPSMGTVNFNQQRYYAPCQAQRQLPQQPLRSYNPQLTGYSTNYSVLSSTQLPSPSSASSYTMSSFEDSSPFEPSNAHSFRMPGYETSLTSDSIGEGLTVDGQDKCLVHDSVDARHFAGTQPLDHSQALVRNPARARQTAKSSYSHMATDYQKGEAYLAPPMSPGRDFAMPQIIGENHLDSSCLLNSSSYDQHTPHQGVDFLQQIEVRSETDASTLSASHPTKYMSDIAESYRRRSAPTKPRSDRRTRGRHHRRPAAGDYPCEYPECVDKGKEYKTKSSLQKHHMRHERPFYCTSLACSVVKDFGSKNDWTRHDKYMHPGEVAQEQWRCAICKIVFDEGDAFAAHVSKAHNGRIHHPFHMSLTQGGGFWCGFCGSIRPISQDSFNPADERYTHIASRHYALLDTALRKETSDWIMPYGDKTKGECEAAGELPVPQTNARPQQGNNILHDKGDCGDEDDCSDEGEEMHEDAEGDVEDDYCPDSSSLSPSPRLSTPVGTPTSSFSQGSRPLQKARFHQAS